MSHINFLFERGLEFDEKDKPNQAFDAYVAGCELALSYLESIPPPPNKPTLSEKVSLILGRIEQVKHLISTRKESPPMMEPPVTRSEFPQLSPTEIDILKDASVVNGRLFLPWIETDSTDSFWTREPFCDPDGFLSLTNASFGCWKRVPELMNDPLMIARVSRDSIVQDVVTDCSFVASLCLITACIFPQDADGVPLYNPSGKYSVKLIFNGIHRKIVVDDYLPVSKSGSLMCTYSSNQNEIWPSIVEKAYMKLNGGYDFPGSNSGIDLYALTGWIPEQIFINDTKWNADIQWKRMMSGFNTGRALITLATVDMDESHAKKIGLVPAHAYAVLDVREVLGRRMIQLKNPWNHCRWNGKFSHLDKENWTLALSEALNYDRVSALDHDDGIFWIHFDSVLQHFESIHVNWNPTMFTYQHVMHLLSPFSLFDASCSATLTFSCRSWPLESGPAVDAYTFAHNPQFGLQVSPTEPTTTTTPSTIWLLLSKHMTTTTTTTPNQDYITLHVFADTDCHRVYSPDMYTVICVGVYVNSPHILASFQVPVGRKSRYTVVVSQHEKTRDLSFSLRAYGKHPFLFGAIGKEYANEEKRRHLFPGGGVEEGGVVQWEQDFKIATRDVLVMVETQAEVGVKVAVVDVETGVEVGEGLLQGVGEFRPKFAFVETVVKAGRRYKVVVAVKVGNVGDVEAVLTVRAEETIEMFS
ncbi:hypothetical protein HDU98_004267 [Podochytrium sp. JEL0797]|nr:hypothetical protein HDU98_004267 [Podochytrium sp. JEL0797]